MLLTDQIAVVTGGGRGIGKAIAVLLAREGAQVVICGRGVDALQKVCDEISANGGKCSLYQTDVKNPANIDQTIQKILDTYGRIDILVNNAGVTRDNLMLRMKDDEWDDVISTNLKGAFLFCRAVYKPMLKQRAGKIINIASVVGLTGNAGQANYAASKAGIIGLTKSLAKELARKNVCVNAVAPGFIETEMTGVLPEAAREGALQQIPMGRFGKAEEVAEVVLFLASHKSNYVTGQVFVVDGGMVM